MQNVTRRGFVGALSIGLVGLAGCQVRPLYGDQDLATGQSRTSSILSSIAIDPPSDRITQLVRNELVFGIDSEGQPSAFRMTLRASSGEQTLGISGTGAAVARSVLVTASYQLFRLGETTPLLENTVISTASYDPVDQRFSNQRARIDAETRAAKDVARFIEAQLAAAFANSL